MESIWYCHAGNFTEHTLHRESLQFRQILEKIGCDLELQYRLFTGFIEVFQNIIQHAVNPAVNETEEPQMTVSQYLLLRETSTARWEIKSCNLIHNSAINQLTLLYSEASPKLSEAYKKGHVGLYLLSQSASKLPRYSIAPSEVFSLSRFTQTITY
jgi:hypothetical protein